MQKRNVISLDVNIRWGLLYRCIRSGAEVKTVVVLVFMCHLTSVLCRNLYTTWFINSENIKCKQACDTLKEHSFEFMFALSDALSATVHYWQQW